MRRPIRAAPGRAHAHGNPRCGLALHRKLNFGLSRVEVRCEVVGGGGDGAVVVLTEILPRDSGSIKHQRGGAVAGAALHAAGHGHHVSEKACLAEALHSLALVSGAMVTRGMHTMQ